jgi:hypothetical protein
MNRMLRQVGQRLAAFLVKPVDHSQASPPSISLHLRAALQPGDVLLGIVLLRPMSWRVCGP